MIVFYLQLFILKESVYMKKLSTSKIKTLSIEGLVEYFRSLTPKVYIDFNNFHLHFSNPGYRPNEKNEERWNKCFDYGPECKYSKLNMNQTRKEFYATLDKTVEKVTGKSFYIFRKQLEMFSLSKTKHKNISDKKKQARSLKFYKLVTPVREELYKMGYNWADLCG